MSFVKNFLLFLLLHLSIFSYSQGLIKMDGFFNDWSVNAQTYVDDSSDSQAIDLLEFSVCDNNEYLFIKIKLADEIDLTEQFYNPAKVFINIDADNNHNTGYYTNNIGSEYGINFFDKFIFDDTNFPIVDTLSLYALGIIPLPTYTSNEFEIAINRNLFTDTIAISIKESLGGDLMPDNGDVFYYIFNNCSQNTTAPIDFSITNSNNLRLMTYNTLSNGLKNSNRVDEHRRIFASVNADIITYQECGNTNYNDVLNFLNTSSAYYPYIYPDLNSGNLTISKYPSLQSWQVANRIDAELIDLPDSIYSTDILIINAHPPCCGNNQGRQEHFDALIEFIHDAKTIGGTIDLPVNTPISFSGDMNLVGYSEQYYTIINGTISDTVSYGNGGFPDWDNTSLMDQVSYFNEKDIAYTWDNPSGDFPPGRLDFVFFTNSVMSVDKSFVISTEDMSSSLLTQNNLFWDDTKNASDHFPVVVDFIVPTSVMGCTDFGACNYDSLATLNDGSCIYNSFSYDTISAINNYIWMNNNLTFSGDYVDTLINSVGCDSILSLNLTIFNSSDLQNDNLQKRKVIRVINFLGQNVSTKIEPFLIYIYDDGTVEKSFDFIHNK